MLQALYLQEKQYSDMIRITAVLEAAVNDCEKLPPAINVQTSCIQQFLKAKTRPFLNEASL
jgi:hypothetical protein